MTFNFQRLDREGRLAWLDGWQEGRGLGKTERDLNAEHQMNVGEQHPEGGTADPRYVTARVLGVAGRDAAIGMGDRR